MKLLGLDFETTGKDTEKSRVIEVGLVLWDTDLHTPTKVAGYLVDPGPGVVYEPEAMQKNGLSAELCAMYGMEDGAAIRQLLGWMRFCDAVVAHNGHEFDYLLLEAWAKRYGLEVPDRLRIDTMHDIELGPKMSSRLVYMAADRGFLNPFPHRAMFDVMTMMKLLDFYNFDRVVELAKSPRITVRALVSYDNRDRAKSRGYHWKPEDKLWTKIIKEINLEKEREACGDRTEKIVGEDGVEQDVLVPGFKIAVLP